jgi:hypothetical protein
VAEAVAAALPLAPVTEIVQPDDAAETPVSVKVPVADVAGETVTDGQLDDAAKLPVK